MISKKQETLLSSIKKILTGSHLDTSGKLMDYDDLLNGCVCMYKETSDKACLDLFIELMESPIFPTSIEDGYGEEMSDDIKELGIGTVSTFLFDATGDYGYKEFADLLYDKLMSYLLSAGKDVNVKSIKDFCYFMPFYTDYETRWNKKNGYNDICERFRTAFELINSCDNVALTDKIFFLRSVVDSLNVISIQIYEDYRLLEDILRQGIKDLFFEKDNLDKILELDDIDRLTASYILFKSIRNGHISSEKYKPLADKLLDDGFFEESRLSDKENIDPEDLRYLGTLMMAAAFCE